MTTFTRLLFVLAAFAAASATPFAADTPASPAAPAPAAPLLIANFTEPVSEVYGYGSWQDRFAIAPKTGFVVQGAKGAQGDGGFCKTLGSALDLSRCAFIEVALAVQPANEVPEYSVAFRDDDGTITSARVRVAQIMPGQPVWFRVPLADFAVTTRDPGKDRTMNWAKVDQWHLQGNWVTKQPAHVLFLALRGRP